MSVLSVEHLSHGFGNHAIFYNASSRLLKGEHIGLIGASDEEKSTSMNIIADKLMSDEGKAEWVKSVRIGYLDQHTVLEKGTVVRDVLKSTFAPLFEMEEQVNHVYDNMGNADEEGMDTIMEELGTIQDLLMAYDPYIIDSKMEEVGRTLGLNDVSVGKDMTELSGGQRTEVLLGKLLLQKPDILLPDKFVSYLDAVRIERLKRYLQEYENAFVPISYNVPLLDNVTNLIYHMENQSLDRYVRDYDEFQEVYAAEKAQLETAYGRQQQEISELEDLVARNKVRVAIRNMTMSRQKKLDRIGVIELARKKLKLEFHFLNARTAGKYILETTSLIIDYDEPFSRPLNLMMECGQKIVLVGANGIGETTLLKNIPDITSALSGSVELGDYLSIGYFEQEMASDSASTCLKEIWKELPPYIQYQVRSALAKCGLTTKRIGNQVRVLSGGEQARVRLCKLINRESNILLLDEPTSHPGVGAEEELERALKEYKGSILLICHKPEFYERLATNAPGYKKWALGLS